MTPDEFEALILEAKDAWDIQKALAPLSQSQRRALSKTADTLKNHLSAYTLPKSASSRLRAYVEKHGSETIFSKETSYCTLSFFALSSLSRLKRHDVYLYNEDYAVLEQIIRDRKPDWLDRWLAFDIDREIPVVKFPLLRKWIKAGLCQKPTVDGYYRLFANNLLYTARNDEPVRPPISQQLIAVG